jgi:predicted nuclease of predicted toxin-antitoxin system
VRLFLDALVSGKRVGAGLRQRGHDVRAVDEEPALEGLADAELLDLAARDDRVLVTGNVRDFVPLVVARASRGQAHAGVLLLPNSIRYQEFGALVSSVHAALGGTAQEGWRDRVAWAQRG